MSEANRRRTVELVALGLAGALVLVGGRLMVRGWQGWQAGAAAEGRGEREEAVRRYTEAARAYVPGSPYVTRALDRLEALAARAQEHGDPTLARDALEGARGAMLAARVGGGAARERRARLDQQLAAVHATLEAPGATVEARETRAAWHALRLAKDPVPSSRPALLTLMGLGLWIGASLGFASRGVDAGLRLRRGPALASGVVFVLGVTLFLVGLHLA